MKDEKSLMASLLEGNEQAFSRVVKEWSPAMRRVASMYARDRSTVEEVLQESWLGFIRGLPNFRGESALRTWMIGIVINIARKRGVKDARTVNFSSLLPDEIGPTVDPSRFLGVGQKWAGHWTTTGQPPAWSPERVNHSREIRKVLVEGLQALPERQRVVVALRDIDGWTAEEVSQALKLTEVNQRVLLHRGRVALRSVLESYLSGDG